MRKIDSEKRINWIANRLKKKRNIPVIQTKSVLLALSDLAWDWKHSEYDLAGLQIEVVLYDIGNQRAPNK